MYNNFRDIYGVSWCTLYYTSSLNVVIYGVIVSRYCVGQNGAISLERNRPELVVLIKYSNKRFEPAVCRYTSHSSENAVRVANPRDGLVL